MTDTIEVRRELLERVSRDYTGRRNWDALEPERLDAVDDLRALLGQPTSVPDEVRSLCEQVERLTNQRDAILLQAQIWACEAKTQQSITREVGDILGGVPSWGPIAAVVENLRSTIRDIAGAAGTDVPDCIDNDGKPYQSQHLANLIAILSAEPAQG